MYSVSRTDAVGVLRTFIKQLYDLRMSSRTCEATSHLLPELYVDSFDNEQIFQQLEMFNNHALKEHRRAIKAVNTRSYSATETVKNSSLASQLPKPVREKSRLAKKHVTFESDSVPNLGAYADDIVEENVETDSNIDSEEESALQKLIDSMNKEKTSVQKNNITVDDDDDDDVDDEDDDDDDSEANLNSDSSDVDSDERTASSGLQRTMQKKKKNQVSAVDDRFFKLAEMEAFLDEQDLKEQRQHSSNADDSEDDDDYDSSADDQVTMFVCIKTTKNSHVMLFSHSVFLLIWCLVEY